MCFDRRPASPREPVEGFRARAFRFARIREIMVLVLNLLLFDEWVDKMSV